MLPRSKRIVVKSSELEEYKRKSSVGHWILVKESAEDLLRESQKVFDDGGCPPSAETASNRTGFTVDNVAVGSGSAERFMNVSGRGYRHVDGQCFAGDPFDRVRTVVADGNLLRLATFRTFRSVQRLSLRRNRMDSVEPIDGHLADTLVYLDVSENQLNPDDISRLSASKLVQLHMSANSLSTVPASITDYRCFLSLERLDLSNNCLWHPKTIYVLSTLHNLRALNLSGNIISFVPYLIAKQPLDIIVIDGGKDTGVNQEEEDNANELVYHVQHIPFVSLNTIDLSNNLIAQNSSVLSLICWPSLKEVKLTANTISLDKNLLTFQDLKSTLSVYNIKIKR